MTLSRLKWVAIVLPVAFLTVLWVLVHTALRSLHRFPDIVVLLGLVAIGTAAFAFAVFEIVKRLERRVLAQNRELGVLLAVGRAASSSPVLGELLDPALDAMLEVLPAEAAEVWLADEGDVLRLVRQRGIAREHPEGNSIAVEELLPGLSAGQSPPVVLRDSPQSGEIGPGWMRDLGLRTYCTLPLWHRQKLVGVLGIASTDDRALCSEWELRLLGGIGEWIALGVANARLHEEVLDGAVLEERLRIARELHDGLAQVLTFINAKTLAVERLLETGRDDEAYDEIAAMKHAVHQVYGDVREAIVGLRTSMGRPGLAPALRRYVTDFERMAGMTLRLVSSEEVESLVLPSAVEIQLIRIVQEALANVRKHSDARAATVELVLADGSLLVTVEDDGRGFDPAASVPTGWPRFGLQTMQERAQAVGGRFELSARPGAGTRVAVAVPLVEVREAALAGAVG